MVAPTSPSERSRLLVKDVPASESIDIQESVTADVVEIADYASAATELKELLQLVYPVALTTALEFLPGFTSVALVGHIQSPYAKEYLDAATLSTMFTNITGYAIGFGLASALDTLASQAFGAKRCDKIGVYFQSGLLVIGAALIPIMLLNWNAGRLLLHLGQDAKVAELTQVFSRYNLIGVPFVLLYELLRKTLQAQGIMSPLVAIAVVGNIVQISLGYWLAYSTSWGFEGVALARSVCNIVLIVLLWGYFHVKPELLTQWWSGWDVREAVKHVGLFLRLGIPGMLMIAMEWWAYEIMSLLAGLLPNPVVSISAHSVVLSTSSLMYMLFVGVSVGANIRVGNHLGANLPNRARAVRSLAIKVISGFGIFVAALAFFGRSWIPLLFVADQEVVDSAATVLLVWAPFEISEGLNCVLQGVFRGAGMQDMAARTNLVSFYLFGMPVAYLMAFRAGWGVEGLWFGMGLSLTLSVAKLVGVSSRWDWRSLSAAAQKRTAE